MLWAANGIITEADHVERLGFRCEELVGKKIATATDGTSMPDGTMMERKFISMQGDPILTLMTVSRTDAVINLLFEIVDHQYSLELVLDGAGIIRDCNYYAAKQLTGHCREQLIGRSINSIIPELFPTCPVGTRFACQAVHRQGHTFRVSLLLFKTACDEYCCNLQRHINYLAPKRCCLTQLNDFCVSELHLGPVLGAGAFGVVRLGALRGAEDLHVAVKFVGNENSVMALREAETLALFRHPNIAQLHATLQTPKYYALVMEFCPGVEMGYYIVSYPVLMTIDEARHYFWQLVSAVAYIHSLGVIHRDITLNNIVVHAVGKTSIQWHNNSIKLIDFGLSSRVEPGSLLDTFCGSPAYASPELLRKTPYDGYAADVWSVGIVLYCTIVGHLPFSSVGDVLNTAMDCSKIIDKACADVLEKILTKDANQRSTIPQVIVHPWLFEHSKSLGYRVVQATMVLEDKFETPQKRARVDRSPPSMEETMPQATPSK